jgi:GNAT superfamily N-acetyltransferase
MTDWTTRFYQPGDETAICALYERVFEQPMTLERWRWQYAHDPGGILLAVAPDGSLAGHYAVSPLRFLMNGETIQGALSLDTMVHPNYRGQGMFTRLANALYDHLAAQGIDFIYGFPNEQSHHGFIKNLGWRDLQPTLPLYVYPLNFSSAIQKVLPVPLLARLGSPAAKLGYRALFGAPRPIPSSIQVRKVQDFDERFDGLLEYAPARLMLKRDHDYLTWRYLKHPDHRYTILAAESGDSLLGYAVLSSQVTAGLNAAYLVDILGRKDAVTALIRAAVDSAQDMDVINCMMFPPYAPLLRRSGFIPLPERLFPQEMHLGVHNNTTRLSDEMIYDPGSWYITWGDHDRI